jgi:hypothetical protein
VIEAPAIHRAESGRVVAAGTPGAEAAAMRIAVTVGALGEGDRTVERNFAADTVGAEREAGVEVAFLTAHFDVLSRERISR